MERLTERHCGVAVIKDKRRLAEAMEKLAAYEEAEEQHINPGDTVYIVLTKDDKFRLVVFYFLPIHSSLFPEYKSVFS